MLSKITRNFNDKVYNITQIIFSLIFNLFLVSLGTLWFDVKSNDYFPRIYSRCNYCIVSLHLKIWTCLNFANCFESKLFYCYEQLWLPFWALLILYYPFHDMHSFVIIFFCKLFLSIIAVMIGQLEFISQTMLQHKICSLNFASFFLHLLTQISRSVRVSVLHHQNYDWYFFSQRFESVIFLDCGIPCMPITYLSFFL